MIEKINKNELLEIYKLIFKTCCISWKNYYPTTSIDYAIKYLFCLNKLEKVFSDGEIFGIRKDKKIIACGGLEIKKDVGALKIIFVDPIFQKQHFGTSIIKFLEKRLILLLATKAELDANLSAISFYKRMGYEHKNKILNYKDGCFTMEKFFV